jgi:hypothetical protein
MAGGNGLAGVSCMLAGAVGALEQPDRLPTIASVKAIHRVNAPRTAAALLVIHGSCCMALLLLEALLALVILIAIVWWTMFAGRHKGELKRSQNVGARDVQDTDRP